MEVRVGLLGRLRRALHGRGEDAGERHRHVGGMGAGRCSLYVYHVFMYLGVLLGVLHSTLYTVVSQ